MSSFSISFACCLTSLVFSLYESDSVQKVILASTLMVSVPSFLCTGNLFSYNKFWLAHEFEMKDRRLSPFSFQLGTSLLTFSEIVLSAFLGMICVYAILGWSFDTLLQQFLFVNANLVLSLQFGRGLCVLCNGNYGLAMKLYTATLFMHAVFSGLLVSSVRFPD